MSHKFFLSWMSLKGLLKYSNYFQCGPEDFISTNVGCFCGALVKHSSSLIVQIIASLSSSDGCLYKQRLAAVHTGWEPEWVFIISEKITTCACTESR